MPEQRVDQEFHDQIWDVANKWMKCERAIEDARELAKLTVGQQNHDLLAALAAGWLERFGA